MARAHGTFLEGLGLYLEQQLLAPLVELQDQAPVLAERERLLAHVEPGFAPVRDFVRARQGQG
jgi:hypothetical protein